jgi:hypothetical protein
MPPFFTRERFGQPQFLAGALLLAFLGQGIYLVYAEVRQSGLSEDSGFGASEQVRITAGWRQLHGGSIAGAPYPDAAGSLAPEISQRAGFDTEHSPLLDLLAAAPLLAVPPSLLYPETFLRWQWLTRIPFLTVGLFLGASLWYVARRLCGNTGGFIALTLYCFSPLCFSPPLIQSSAVWHTEPEIVAAWGSFGAIFTAIAVAHTLYAPREVVLWNWRRIVLLGVSLAIAVGAQFSMIIVVPLALACMLYVAPIRRGAALVIWFSGCLLGLFLLFAAYFFHPHVFWQAMHHASFWGATWRSFTVRAVYREVARGIVRACPPFALLLPVAVVTYILRPRSRYFGNTAPGLIALIFLALGMAHPHLAGAGFLLASLPFLFIFVAGVLADLIETPYRPFVTAAVGGLLAAYILWRLLALAHIPIG